ncbi:hypothetical protein [Nocardia panacis]|uniref:tetratricopeptide repeat protein n=1 Tax=Nocardia panacis TaxID=2340916 RepID=UPI003F712887
MSRSDRSENASERGATDSSDEHGAAGAGESASEHSGFNRSGGFDQRESSQESSESAGERGGFKRGGGSDRREGSGQDFDRTESAGGRGDFKRDQFERRAGERGGSERRGSDDRGWQRREDGERGGAARGEARGGFGRDDDRRRGGEGSRGGGRSLDRRPPRPEEPDLPDDVQAGELEMAVRRDLLSLDKGNAETVARHLVMAARLIDDDPGLALAHARAARQRAGRIAVVRETAGVTAYHAGEWAEALSELRTARRMSGGSGLLAVMADCERGLGRPERAIELGRSDEARALHGDEAIELRIVVAGARMDMGQFDQAVVTLQTPDLDPARTGSTYARLFYAYADALVAAGRTEEGLTWFLNAAAADLDGDTDAEDRAAELTGENYGGYDTDEQ